MARSRPDTLYNVEQVITDKDAIELIVPVAQPNKWACINKNGAASDPAPLNNDNKTVLLMTG